MSFTDKWLTATAQSRLIIGLAPRLPNMPAPIARYDDPFLPFGGAIIEATLDYAAGYVFDLAAYLALGAAGARALERTIPLVPRDRIRVLHGPFITADYAQAAFETAFDCDAVTLATRSQSVMVAYTSPNHAAFIDTYTEGFNIGFYTPTSLDFATMHTTWVTEPIIYASGRDDFAEAAARAAAHYREASFA